ncbi:MAG: type II toxin-antitoxin system VapC family toxin [Lachnospiraceae bacterium]|nr:type II toxin-antitoxin system VapC family toxin [Lachnospiraceae bacterium]
MNYILDTNTIIYFIKGTYPSLETRLKNTPAQSVFIPAIVKAEIEYGARKSRDYEKTIEIYRKFFEAFRIVPFDGNMSIEYGRIRSDLEKRGDIIGPNDLIIAATALSMGGRLITHNTSEFGRIEGILLEDWTETS